MLVRELSVTPDGAGLGAFVGARAGGGFRKVLDLQTRRRARVAPLPPARRRPRRHARVGHGDVDRVRRGAVDLDSWRGPREQDRDPPAAGRHLRGLAVAAARCSPTSRTDGPPVLLGPDAPDITDPDDPLRLGRVRPAPRVRDAAHPPPRRVARRRLVHVDVFFRDTCTDGDANETVVHEYTVATTVDPDTMVITACTPSARVLPWVECPQAIGSADALVGLGRSTTCAPRPARKLVGPSTCTHLNDVLRGLEDVHWLTDLLPS